MLEIRSCHIFERQKISIKQLLVPGMLFEDMGITYLGPVDGHDIKNYMKIFQEAKKIDHAVLVHVLTEKGKGYLPAEKMPSKFHGTGPFDIATGQQKSSGDKDTYTDVFAKVMYRMGKRGAKACCNHCSNERRDGSDTVCKEISGQIF